MVNDYLITSGGFIASSNIEHPIQFSILHYQNLWGDACFIRVKSWSKTNKNIHWLLWSRNKIPLLGDKKKNPLFLALCFRGNQSSRYHIIMMIKKRKYNGTIHLVISKDCLWCCITQKPGDKIFNTRTYTYVNALMFSKHDLFGPVIRFIRFFNTCILTLKFLSYLKTFIFREFVFKPTSQIIQKSWNHLLCVNFTHFFSIYCLD